MNRTVVPECESRHRVYVDYDMPFETDLLEADFSPGGISPLFDRGYSWINHPGCDGSVWTPGFKEMILKHYDRESESDENIADMRKQGYRPATHVEAYAFAKANPELQLRFWIIALGSFTEYNHWHCVAVLRERAGKRILSHFWYVYRWCRAARFLFVAQQGETGKELECAV